MASLTVGPGLQFQTVRAAVAASHDGDTIYVQAGTYVNDGATINTKISIVGVGGMAHFVGNGLIGNGKAFFVTNTDVTFDHIEFSGAKVADHNGAGIRYQAGNLTITNCYFHDNEDGILGASSPGGTIKIDNSEFAHNGYGDGQSHNIYIGTIDSLTITDSYIHDAVVGHEIKSRAAVTTIENNRIVDGTGTASYSIDLPNGGIAIVKNNIIQQGPNSQNNAIISYSGEQNQPQWPNSQLQIDNNTVINEHANPRFVVNWGTAPVSITNNDLFGVTAAQIGTGPNTQANNAFLTTKPTIDSSHPWDTSADTNPPPPPPENHLPLITSNGGGATATVSVAENTTAVTKVVATDSDTGQTLTYSIVPVASGGGADASKFVIDATTGALAFKTAPNFEAPTDALAPANVYDVTVQVSDNKGGIDKQAIAVKVTDQPETPPPQNHLPLITSNGGGATATVSVAENTTAVTKVVATDSDTGQTLAYSIVPVASGGGADASKFVIDATTGALAFKTAPNFEAPTDALAPANVYDVTVQVSDNKGGIDKQAIAVKVTDQPETPPPQNHLPLITSNGGGATASVSVAENTTAVTKVVATDSDTGQTLAYSIVPVASGGGADASKFVIDATTGALAFKTAPNFEAPTDALAPANVYDITVQVSDNKGGIDKQAIAVKVTDQPEVPQPTGTGGGNATGTGTSTNLPTTIVGQALNQAGHPQGVDKVLTNAALWNAVDAASNNPTHADNALADLKQQLHDTFEHNGASDTMDDLAALLHLTHHTWTHHE